MPDSNLGINQISKASALSAREVGNIASPHAPPWWLYCMQVELKRVRCLTKPAKCSNTVFTNANSAPRKAHTARNHLGTEGHEPDQ